METRVTCTEHKCSLILNKRLTLYDQNGKRWNEFGSRQSKRQQSQNNNNYRIGTTGGYPYYGIKQKFIQVNRKARQLPKLSKRSRQYMIYLAQNPSVKERSKQVPFTTNQIPNKTYNNGFRIKQNDKKRHMSKYNKFIGQQIKIEINQQKVKHHQLNPDCAESGNLLFYDFNSGARQYGAGAENTNNNRLLTNHDFRRTGMAGAKFLNKNKLEEDEIVRVRKKKRPITSHFRGGDRLPSRQSKTRDRSRRLVIASKNRANNEVEQSPRDTSPQIGDHLTPEDEFLYE